MITINDSFQNNSPKPLNNRYLKFVSGSAQAYNSTAEANVAIPSAYRHLGLTTLVNDGTGNKEYWYKDGILDANLVVKETPIVPSLDLVLEQGGSLSNDRVIDLSDKSLIIKNSASNILTHFSLDNIINQISYADGTRQASVGINVDLDSNFLSKVAIDTEWDGKAANMVCSTGEDLDASALLMAVDEDRFAKVVCRNEGSEKMYVDIIANSNDTNNNQSRFFVNTELTFSDLLISSAYNGAETFITLYSDVDGSSVGINADHPTSSSFSVDADNIVLDKFNDAVELDLRIFNLPEASTGKVLYYDDVAGQITYEDIDYGIQKFTKGITITSPTASENLTIFYTTEEITVVNVADCTLGSTPSVTYNIKFAATRNGSATNVFSSDRTIASAAGSTTTTFANATIPANRWVWIETSAVFGVINDFSVVTTFSK